MGDDDELGLGAHISHVLGVADNIRFVKRRLDLVHDAERRGAHLEYRKVKRDSDKCLFAAGQKAYIRHRLAGRLNLYLNAAFEGIVFVLERERGFAAAEKLKEGLTEVFVNELKLLGEYLLHFACYIVYYTHKFGFCLLDIVTLAGEEVISRADTLVLLDGADIRRAEGGYPAAQLGNALLLLLQVLHRLAQLLSGGIRKLVVFPELVEYLLFLHVGGVFLALESGAGLLKLE